MVCQGCSLRVSVLFALLLMNVDERTVVFGVVAALMHLWGFDASTVGPVQAACA